MFITPESLPQFVAETDRLGGPGSFACTEYWENFSYIPQLQVDQMLDPFGENYTQQQISLYREISRKDLDQSVNEFSSFNLDAHVAAINPYDHGSPGELAQHLERLSHAIRFASPPRGSRLLDMGCGWGLSSELAAYCGLSVLAVDINKDFVELVNRRAARFGLDVVARQSAFDEFATDERFATVMFYECFHHAVRPWDLLKKMKRLLQPDGRIVMAGEPINNIWWENWGLRLDALSVYCIHKFGWFESGWSADFLKACFQRAGLNVQILDQSQGVVDPVVVGTRAKVGRVDANEIGRLWDHQGWTVEPGYMTSTGRSELRLVMPVGSTSAVLNFQNFRSAPMYIKIEGGGEIIIARHLPPGFSYVEILAEKAAGNLFVTSETWIPDQEQGNGDTRRIGIHLEGVTFL